MATEEVPVKQFCQNFKEGKMVSLQFYPTEQQLASIQNLMLKYVSALKQNIDLWIQNTLPLLGVLSIFDPNSYSYQLVRTPFLRGRFCLSSCQALFPKPTRPTISREEHAKISHEGDDHSSNGKEGKTIMPAKWCMSQLIKPRSFFISLLSSCTPLRYHS